MTIKSSIEVNNEYGYPRYVITRVLGVEWTDVQGKAMKNLAMFFCKV